MTWQPPSDSPVIRVIEDQSRRVIEAYRADPGLIEEHANGERRITQGGYGDRQVYELVQNGVDEMREQAGDVGGEIKVVLTRTHLYCANEGDPVTPEGADTILRMSVSRKRGGQIGRFGVGVKSVLSISDTPQFFSRTGAFGFDRQWSAQKIREIHPDAGDTPVLRMARKIDAAEEAAADPVLAELLKWATTVVRLPLKAGTADRLGRDLNEFPVQFLLFSPHVGNVILEDRRPLPHAKRAIFQDADGVDRHIQEERTDGSEVFHKWKVFTRRHAPSVKALAAAGELHDRPEIEISWAVPDKSQARGTFWAYFPTNYATTLRGILNAPWKTSEDRQNLFDRNEFNEELIEVAADLVVESLPMLAVADDPARYIDFLPGRGREAPQWADQRLTQAIWDTCAQTASVPDLNGAFRRPGEVRLHPAGLRQEWLDLWAGHEGAPTDWCHHSLEKRERRARIETIFEKAGEHPATLRNWLEALVADGTPEASARAIRIAADIVRTGHELAPHVKNARIVLTERHDHVAPVSGQVYRRTSTDELDDDMAYVDPRVTEDVHAEQGLETLGVREADAAGRLAAVVEQGFTSYGPPQWSAFWELLRAADPTTGLAVLRERGVNTRNDLHVKTISGTFHPIAACLLPGPVVPDDGSRDADIAIDLRFHASDRPILKDLGAINGPQPARDPRGETWFDDYHEAAWEAYLRTLDDKTHRVQKTTIRVDGAAPAGPLGFLRRLSPEGRALYIERLPHVGLVTQWTMQVGKQGTARRHLPSPLVWMGRRHGRVHTSRGLRRTTEAVGPALKAHADILPVATITPEIADALDLPQKVTDVPQKIWDTAVHEAATSEDDGFAGKVYALLIKADAHWPEGQGTRCRIGETWSTDIPDEQIAVTADPDEYRTLVREGVPALLAPDTEVTETLIDGWGMRRFSEVIEEELRYVAEAEPVLLLEEYPALKLVQPAKVKGWSLQQCGELEKIIRTPHGTRSVPLDTAVQDSTILLANAQGDLDVLLAVDKTLKLGLGHEGCRSVLERRKKQRENERVQQIRRATSEEEKLLALIGEEGLRRGLPAGLEDAERRTTGRQPTGRRLAELAKHAHGKGIIRHHAKDIGARLPDAPLGFSGASSSRRFLAELGLSETYAGTRTSAPPVEEEVQGPTDFPRLHDYQEALAQNMVTLLKNPVPQRAMLRLPTGAGKTRVAVEAVIRVAKERGLTGPILWIAESDELCNQAVESWKFVWGKVGPRQKLTISRLIGTNQVSAVTTNPHLVVATDAKLDSCLGDEEYTWLRKAALVLVDEAHNALQPRYTRILRHLGLDIARDLTERPLIGLTATPYRGTNEEETRRLAERFHRNRLDTGIFGEDDPYAALQDLEVLARVEHRRLDGVTIRLSQAELERTETFGVLPSSAGDQLALNDERNDMLLREIGALPDDWPILVFAASVNHAKLLAAMLNDKGVRSASIDSAQPMAERRERIEDFRRGGIRVLTNYGVLAQGFDAPATRAVVIARPTYSPNIYQQMIGRGLRGPKNGGKEMCTILDVQDNIENFGKQLAFTGFEYLWGRE